MTYTDCRNLFNKWFLYLQLIFHIFLIWKHNR